MRNRAILSALLVGCLSLGAGLYAAEDGEPTERYKQLEKLLSTATDRFELGRYIEAKAALEKIMAENPSDEECWKLREVFGDRILRHMVSFMDKGRTLGKTPEMLLQRAQLHEQESMMSPANVKDVVTEVIQNPENVKRLYELSIIGQFAVPDLIDFLRSTKSEVERTNASYCLIHLGPQVVLPVAETLAAGDDLLSQHVCDVLRKIRPLDMRSLHMIKRIYDNPQTLPTVRGWAEKALEEITGQKSSELKSADEYIYEEANRLYLGGPTVAEEMDDLDKSFWYWDANAGVDGKKGRLARIEIPTFALDDMYTQELVYDGLQLTDKPERYQLLLSSSLLQQAKENETFSSILDLAGMTLPDAERLKAQILNWQQRLYKNQRVAWTVGGEMLVKVLDKALQDGKASVAIAAIEGIEKTVNTRNGWEKISNWSVSLERPVVDEPQPDAAAADKKIAEKKLADKKETVPASTEPVPVAAPSHPLLSALDNPDRRVRFAAANCLMRVGLPVDNSRYKDVAPILVDGAREAAAQVCLIVSNDLGFRNRMAARLESKGLIAMTAPGGREGYALAMQNPPKDCVMIDSEVNEFAYLNQRLQMENIIAGSPLPLVIVTTSGRIDNIESQFDRNKWRVERRTDKSAETPGLYDSLVLAKRRNDRTVQVVSIITNENVQARKALKNFLLLEAERRSRPERQTELLTLMQNEKLLSDIFPARSAYVNVFMDEELSGWSAMKTLQKFRNNIVTRHIPVALFCKEKDREELGKEYSEFLDDKADLRLLDYETDAAKLFDEALDMTALNKLSEKNYVRKMYDAIALRSAKALSLLDADSGVVNLTDEEVEWLREVVRSKARPLNIRCAVAMALGHLRVEKAVKTLSSVFSREKGEVEDVKLRVACLHALGSIDISNEYKELKLKALQESDIAIQEVASRALALADGGVALHNEILQRERPNVPEALLTEQAAKPVEKKAEGGEETAKEGAEEGKEATEDGEEGGKEEAKEGEKKEGDKKEDAGDDLW